MVAFAFTKGQARTSAVSVLCRTAMESAAKTIWLISAADPDERGRRCFGFIESERGWQDKFDIIEAETLAARTDELVAAERVKCQGHRQRFEKRLAQITDLPVEERRRLPGPTKLVDEAADWVDANRPREPDPELDKVMKPTQCQRAERERGCTATEAKPTHNGVAGPRRIHAIDRSMRRHGDSAVIMSAVCTASANDPTRCGGRG